MPASPGTPAAGPNGRHDSISGRGPNPRTPPSSAAAGTVLSRTISFVPFAVLDEKKSGRSMAKTVSIIGIEEKELRWVRSLILLLRHPDPSVPELARQAILYLTRSAADRPEKPIGIVENAG